jgi:hypothetical protein
LRDLTEDTLADLFTLGSAPPDLRRVNTQLVRPSANPSAGSGYTAKVPNEWWQRLIAVSATLTCSATAGARQVQLQYCDDSGNPFYNVPLGPPLSASETAKVYGSLANTAPTPAGGSETVDGSVTNPAASTDISGGLSLAPGTWQLTGTAFLSGTVTAADADNMVVTLQGSYVAQITYPGVVDVPGTATAVVTVASTTGAWVTSSNAASGSGAIYNASITATQLAPAGQPATILDFTMKSGWQQNLAVSNIQSGDQLSGITYLTERYPSNWADGSLESDEEDLLRRLARALWAENHPQM